MKWSFLIVTVFQCRAPLVILIISKWHNFCHKYWTSAAGKLIQEHLKCICQICWECEHGRRSVNNFLNWYPGKGNVTVSTSTNILNKIQFMINIKFPHVSTLGAHHQGTWGWYISAEIPKSLILVICILLNAFLDWYIGCKNMHGISNIKFRNVTDPES